DVVSLRNDLRVWLLPERDSTDMVRVSVGENDVLDRPVRFAVEDFLDLACDLSDGCVDQHVSGGSLNEVDIPGRGNHRNRVVDVDRFFVILCESASSEGYCEG